MLQAAVLFLPPRNDRVPAQPHLPWTVTAREGKCDPRAGIGNTKLASEGTTDSKHDILLSKSSVFSASMLQWSRRLALHYAHYRFTSSALPHLASYSNLYYSISYPLESRPPFASLEKQALHHTSIAPARSLRGPKLMAQPPRDTQTPSLKRTVGSPTSKMSLTLNAVVYSKWKPCIWPVSCAT